MPLYSDFSDLELTELLRTGDTAAYTAIYNRHFDVLFVHAYQKLNNKQEAQDIIHEIFTQLWVKKESLLIKTDLKSYLYISVRNRILDLIAHQKIESNYIASFDLFLTKNYAVTDYRIREKQLKDFIEKGIDGLPDKMKEIFELSRKKELSHGEIAKQLNLSEQTVKKQINNALKILRNKLGVMLFI